MSASSAAAVFEIIKQKFDEYYYLLPMISLVFWWLRLQTILQVIINTIFSAIIN